MAKIVSGLIIFIILAIGLGIAIYTEHRPEAPPEEAVQPGLERAEEIIEQDERIKALPEEAIRPDKEEKVDRLVQEMIIPDMDKFVDELFQEGMFQSLIEGLRAEICGARWSAISISARVLAERGDPRIVEPLITALKDESSDVREIAAEVLGDTGDPRAVEPLSAALKDEDLNVRRSAVEALRKIGDPRAVTPLITALGDEDSDVRKSAIEALVKIGKPAVEPLIAALKYDDVRLIVAEVLGEIGDPRAVTHLVAALRDESRGVRRSAKEALVKIGKPAIEPLITALGAEDWESREIALVALREIGWKPGDDTEKSHYLIAIRRWDELVKIGKPAVEPLITALGAEDQWIQRGAVEALREIGDPRAVSSLIAVLKNRHSDFHVLRIAKEALVKIGKPAVEPLIATLKYDDVRLIVAKVLWEIGDPRAVRPLIAALRDKDLEVQRKTIEALVKIGKPAVEPLIATLRDRSEDRRARWMAARALGEIGDPRAVEPLITALRDENLRIRWIATGGVVGEALVKIGKPAVEPLIAALKYDDVRLIVAEVLGEIGDPRAVEPLSAALRDNQWITARVLGKIGDPRAVESLITALKDKDSDVRSRTAEVLGKIGDPRAVEPLIAALGDRDSFVRESAAAALGKIGDPRAVEPLITTALKDENRDVREEATEALVKIGEPAVEPLIAVGAMGALGKIGGLRVIEFLSVTLKDRDSDVRWNAALALGETGDPRAVEPLSTALRDRSRKVLRAAIEAMEKIGKPAVEPLSTALRNEDSDVRRRAAEALGEIGDPRAVEPLIASLKDRHSSDVRWSAAEALRKIGDPRAVEPLIAALGDENRCVREIAAVALWEITGKAFGEDPVKWQGWWEENKETFLR